MPTYAGQYAVSGVSRGVETDGGVFNLVLGRNGSFLYLRAPDGDVWWTAQVADPGQPSRDGITDGLWLARLGALYRAEALPSAVLAATVRLDRPTPTVHHTLAPVPVWQDRRAVLVGDAAHPVGAGQGASMAVEDGLALAAAVAGTGSVPEALVAYERARRPRIAKMLKAARDNREVKRGGAIRRGIEAVMMPVVLRYFYERATAWLYTYRPDVPWSEAGSRPVSRTSFDPH